MHIHRGAFTFSCWRWPIRIYFMFFFPFFCCFVLYTLFKSQKNKKYSKWTIDFCGVVWWVWMWIYIKSLMHKNTFSSFLYVLHNNESYFWILINVSNVHFILRTLCGLWYDGRNSFVWRHISFENFFRYLFYFGRAFCFLSFLIFLFYIGNTLDSPTHCPLTLVRFSSERIHEKD